MGCWNGTCGISHLPIRAGDDIRLFILVPSNYGYGKFLSNKDEHTMFSSGGIVYAHDFMKPLTLPIRGKYNDYGGIEEIKKSPYLKAIVNWVNTELSLNNFTVTEEAPKNNKFENIDDFLNSIERGGTPFGTMMVLETIYQSVVLAQEESIDPEYDTHRLRAAIKEDLQLAQTYIGKEIAQKNLTKLGSKMKLKSAEDLASKQKKLSAMMFGMIAWPQRKPLSPRDNHPNIMEGIVGGMGGRENIILDSFGKEYFLPVFAKSDTSIDEIADYVQFSRNMYSNRRTWITQAGSGSQADNYRIHRRLAEAVLAHINMVADQHAEDIDLSHPAELAHFKKQY